MGSGVPESTRELEYDLGASKEDAHHEVSNQYVRARLIGPSTR